MKVKIKKNMTLEDLFKNENKSWEETMSFLKNIKYGHHENEIFNGINCGEVIKIRFIGNEYCVNKYVLEIIEEKPKEVKLLEKLMQLDTRETSDCIIKIQDKINEIIDKLNELEKENE